MNIYSCGSLNAYCFLKNINDTFDKHKIAIDLVTVSESNISLTLDINLELKELTDDLLIYSRIKISSDKSQVC